MARVVREREMAVPVEAISATVLDFESYPKFMPEVVSVKPHAGGSEKKKIVSFELEIMKRFQYDLEFQIDPLKEVAWKLVESNFFKVNEGRWVFKKIDAKRTHVQYEVEVGFGFFVPGWITKKLTETTLPKMLDNFEEQARKRS